MSPHPPVLVVDDDADSNVLVTKFVARLLLVNPVTAFASSADAAGYLRDAADGLAPLPGLALFDLHMPGLDGFDLLQLIRDTGLEGRFPVVLLTGSSEMDDLDRAYALGVTSYLVKPVGYEALGHVVRGLAVPWALAAT